MNVDEQNALLDAQEKYDALVEALCALADEWERSAIGKVTPDHLRAVLPPTGEPTTYTPSTFGTDHIVPGSTKTTGSVPPTGEPT